MDIFLAALAAAAVAGTVVWLLLRNKTAVLSERLRTRGEENTRLASDLSAAQSSLAEIRGQKAEIEQRLAAEHASAAEKIRTLTETHERLVNEFKALSADALKHNNTAFLELARESFAQLRQQSTGDLEKRQQAIDALVKPLRESLEKVDVKIGDLEKTRAEAYGALGEQLKALSTAQLQLQSETSRLSTALSSTAAAGTWGELQLRRVVELSGMTAYCDFSEQESTSTETGRFRPDLVVRLPGGQRIVVDAKAPNEAYRDAASATDETVRAARLAEHAAKVRGHIDALGAKSYWEQFQPSPEFVVLFLPGDQFLAGALQGDPSLIERAILKKVLLTTPATLIALLKAAAYGWRQEAISKNAEEISRLGRDLYDRVSTFADHLEKVGKGLDTAVKGYNAAVGSFEGSLLAGARRFSELGAKGSKDAALPSSVETAPRELTRRT